MRDNNIIDIQIFLSCNKNRKHSRSALFCSVFLLFILFLSVYQSVKTHASNI